MLCDEGGGAAVSGRTCTLYAGSGWELLKVKLRQSCRALHLALAPATV